MPSIFPNDVFYKNDIEKLDIIVKAYQETKRLTYDNYNISFDVFESVLYPNFVEFFKEISKREIRMKLISLQDAKKTFLGI